MRKTLPQLRLDLETHSPRMMVDEGALPRGTALLAGCAIEFLANGFADT